MKQSVQSFDKTDIQNFVFHFFNLETFKLFIMMTLLKAYVMVIVLSKAHSSLRSIWLILFLDYPLLVHINPEERNFSSSHSDTFDFF